MAKTKQKETAAPKQNNILENLKKINIKSVLIVAVILMAFVIGRLTQKVEDLTGGSINTATTTGTNTTTGTGTGTTTPTVSLDTIKSLWNQDLIKIGDASKKVLFVEVGDPSCPFCHAAGGLDGAVNKAANLTLVADGGTYQAPVPEMRKLVDAGSASFVYIYYPGHGNGQMGMEALYCAYEKGASTFWKAHDLLMSQAGYQIMNGYDANQVATTGPIVKNDKTQSGAMATFLKSAVDPTFMKSCLDSGKYDQRLNTDQALATSLGVTGTPGFFINATNFAGAYSWDTMKPTVDAALK